jgi:hypothetical protein
MGRGRGTGWSPHPPGPPTTRRRHHQFDRTPEDSLNGSTSPGQGGTAEQVRDSLINAELVARGSVVLDAAPDDVPFTGAPDAAERIAAVAPKSARAAVAWWHALINADRALAPADAYQLAAALSRADEVRDA